MHLNIVTIIFVNNAICVTVLIIIFVNDSLISLCIIVLHQKHSRANILLIIFINLTLLSMLRERKVVILLLYIRVHLTGSPRTSLRVSDCVT